MIDATSSDIDVYNAFVNSAAAGATYDGSTVSWKAIGSTATVNARTNVGGFGDSVPVYLVDGTAKSDNELGAAETQLGESSSTSSWLRSGFSPLASYSSQPMFAMSETLIAVPEPSTHVMVLAGLACGGYSM